MFIGGSKSEKKCRNHIFGIHDYAGGRVRSADPH